MSVLYSCCLLLQTWITRLLSSLFYMANLCTYWLPDNVITSRQVVLESLWSGCSHVPGGGNDVHLSAWQRRSGPGSLPFFLSLFRSPAVTLLLLTWHWIRLLWKQQLMGSLPPPCRCGSADILLRSRRNCTLGALPKRGEHRSFGLSFVSTHWAPFLYNRPYQPDLQLGVWRTRIGNSAGKGLTLSQLLH